MGNDKGVESTFIPLNLFETCNVEFHPHFVAEGETQYNRASYEILLVCEILWGYVVFAVYVLDLIAPVLLGDLDHVELLVRILHQLLPGLLDILLLGFKLIELVFIGFLVCVLLFLFLFSRAAIIII